MENSIPNAPTYHIDTNSPLPSITAAPDLGIHTPIALLKLKSVYSSGKTIVVSSFVAYVLTRGRVRLIDRSNGSRSLLHLPSSFNPQATVIDMAVGPAPSGGGYLACVTSDGGLVIWEVPKSLNEDRLVPTVLHVAPCALQIVKWHLRTPDIGSSSSSGESGSPGVIAVASDREIYVFQIFDALAQFRGQEVTLSTLATISDVASVPSPLVGFAFDLAPRAAVNVPALAIISIDSTVTLWNIKGQLAFWTRQVPGEGLPSSVNVLDGGLLVGRKHKNVGVER